MIDLKKAYISSDFHLFHTNIIEFCNRPYPKTIDGMLKMNEDILKEVDNLPKDCEFLYLGDLFFDLSYLKKNSLLLLKRIVTRMKSENRKLYIVLGNHDIQVAKVFKQDPVLFFEYIGFDKVYDCPIVMNYNNKNVIFSHKPILLKSDDFINVHGHTHNRIADEAINNKALYYNVCLDYQHKIIRFNNLFK